MLRYDHTGQKTHGGGNMKIAKNALTPDGSIKEISINEKQFQNVLEKGMGR